MKWAIKIANITPFTASIYPCTFINDTLIELFIIQFSIFNMRYHIASLKHLHNITGATHAYRFLLILYNWFTFNEVPLNWIDFNSTIVNCNCSIKSVFIDSSEQLLPRINIPSYRGSSTLYKALFINSFCQWSPQYPIKYQKITQSICTLYSMLFNHVFNGEANLKWKTMQRPKIIEKN